MPTSGPNNWGTSADDSSTGTTAWTNTGPSGGSPPQSSVDLVHITHYLDLTNFGFSVPGTATIAGIQFNTRFTVTGSINAIANSIKAIKGGTVGGTDHNTGTPNMGMAETFGNTSSDLWGLSWSASDINASNFGIAIAMSGSGASGGATVVLSTVTATVGYTLPDSDELHFDKKSISQPIALLPRASSSAYMQPSYPQNLISPADNDGAEAINSRVMIWNP